MIEKIAVIITLPPLNIYCIERGIIFMEKKEIVEEMKSQNAGIEKISILTLSDYPLARDSTLSSSYSFLYFDLYAMKTK